MKIKSILTLSFALITAIGFAQTQTFPGQVKIKNIPLGSTNDSVVVIGADGSLRHVKASSMVGAFVDKTSTQSIGGLKTLTNDLVIGSNIFGKGPSTGTRNLVMGESAGLGNVSASRNVIIGYAGLARNTVGVGKPQLDIKQEQ
ncbi:hypothetical protein [Pedobacter sp. NJ-S-72]